MFLVFSDKCCIGSYLQTFYTGISSKAAGFTSFDGVMIDNPIFSEFINSIFLPVCMEHPSGHPIPESGSKEKWKV